MPYVTHTHASPCTHDDSQGQRDRLAIPRMKASAAEGNNDPAGTGSGKQVRKFPLRSYVIMLLV